MVKYAQLLGLGEKAALDIAQEQPGTIASEPPAVGGMGLSVMGMLVAAAGYLPPVAGAVAQEPAATEAYGVLGVFARGRNDVEGLVDRPGAGEKFGMGFAGIDDAFDLGVGQNVIA